jgi:serine/threonine-protein kinase
MVSENTTPASGRYHRIGKYELKEHIATGGMGAVYRAVDREDGCEVALKVLAPELAARPQTLERFRREAHHGLKLHHENIVALYELGEENGVYFLVMEFVDGVDVQTLIQRTGPMDAAQACDIVRQVALGLDHAWQTGIIHRDIKPSNILLADQGRRRVAKLSDLGLAIQAHDEECRLTRFGNTVGTVDYMAPEQARNSRSVDVRSDIYSLGCTWFHMLAGRAPFAEGSLAERVFKHALVAAPDIRQFNRGVPPCQVTILGRMLEKVPEKRYQTPAELIIDLTSAMASQVRLAAWDSFDASDPDAFQETALQLPANVEPATPPKTVSGAASRRGPREPSGDVAADALQSTAARYFERANQFLAADDPRAALAALRICCQLAPENLEFRQALREAQRASQQRVSGRGWFARAACLPDKLRIWLARRTGKGGQVLAYGERVLSRNVRDLATHVRMAEAAEDLELPELAAWLLEQARMEDAGNIIISRALAGLYERQRNIDRAVTAWQEVCRAAPGDLDASRKVKDLLAQSTIARACREDREGRSGRRPMKGINPG